MKKEFLYLTITFIFLLLISSCGQVYDKRPETTNNVIQEIAAEDLMDITLVDGFDFPVGNKDGQGEYKSKTDGKIYKSWYIATNFVEKYSLGIHPGIDLNGTGGGNTDFGQPVFSIAKGMVENSKDYGSPWGNVVLIRHKYLENGLIKTCYSLYAHLNILNVKKGDFVQKRSLIGEIGTGNGRFAAHLHLEIRKENMKDFGATYWPSSNSKDIQWVQEHYESPREFIKSHRRISCPHNEDRIIIAIKKNYMLYYYEKGSLKNKFEIALSQNPVGHKEREGDLKLPEGEYYICEKQKGPFYGSYSDFLGNRVLRISYPNKFDAEAGFKKGLISTKERDQIISANNNRKIPSKNTKLGGGIVIHGWKGDWVANGNQNLTWGCISMHNKDLDSFFDIIQLNTKIIITN